jgi:hypothetical protein
VGKVIYFRSLLSGDYYTCGIAVGGERMSKLSEGHIKEIAAAVAEQLPDDPALQQVRIAREVLGMEAEFQGSSFAEYIKLLRDHVGKVK